MSKCRTLAGGGLEQRRVKSNTETLLSFPAIPSLSCVFIIISSLSQTNLLDHKGRVTVLYRISVLFHLLC